MFFRMFPPLQWRMDLDGPEPSPTPRVTEERSTSTVIILDPLPSVSHHRPTAVPPPTTAEVTSKEVGGGTPATSLHSIFAPTFSAISESLSSMRSEPHQIATDATLRSLLATMPSAPPTHVDSGFTMRPQMSELMYASMVLSASQPIFAEGKPIAEHDKFIMTNRREGERLMAQAQTLQAMQALKPGLFILRDIPGPWSMMELNPSESREKVLQSLHGAINCFTLAYQMALVTDDYISKCRYLKTGPDSASWSGNIKKLLRSATRELEVFPPLDLSTMVGSTDYYQTRAKDFRDRNGPNLPVPYYLDYGVKYEKRFQALKDKLSPRGKAWVTTTHQLLQHLIEQFRENNPQRFAALERDTAKFREFAFKTHPKAYVDSGLCELSLTDMALIGSEPDLGDTIFSEEGRRQIISTAGACAERYVEWFKKWTDSGNQDTTHRAFRR